MREIPLSQGVVLSASVIHGKCGSSQPITD